MGRRFTKFNSLFEGVQVLVDEYDRRVDLKAMDPEDQEAWKAADEDGKTVEEIEDLALT